MNSVATSREFFDAIMSADLVLRDGIGMQILLSLLNQPPGLNLNGTDLIPRILRRYAGRPIALFGTQEPYLGQARSGGGLRTGPGQHLHHGERLSGHRVLCPAGRGPQAQPDRAGHGHAQAGGGRPMLRAALGFPCLIVCGGAIIDFLGGKMPGRRAGCAAPGLNGRSGSRLNPGGCSGAT